MSAEFNLANPAADDIHGASSEVSEVVDAVIVTAYNQEHQLSTAMEEMGEEHNDEQIPAHTTTQAMASAADNSDDLHANYGPTQLMSGQGPDGPVAFYMSIPENGEPQYIYAAVAMAETWTPQPPSPPPPPPAPVAPPAPTMAMAVPVNLPVTTAMNAYDLDAAATLFNAAMIPSGAPAQFLHQYAPVNLAPSNANVKAFLKSWVRQTSLENFYDKKPFDEAMQVKEEVVNEQISKPICVIRAADLNGDHCDLQGIDWAAMGTTFSNARMRRKGTYKNYISLKNSDNWVADPARNLMPRTHQPYFNFQQTHLRKDIRIPHFQLRNLLATASRDRAYFPGTTNGTINHYNMLTGETSLALKFPNYSDVQISTIAAGHGVLVAGGFSGEYCVTNIDSEYVDQPPWEVKCAGSITSRFESGISNHVQVHGLRGSGPVASFSSNDQALRVLDIITNKLLYDVRFDIPLNCSAMSPDGRLRVVMGDTTNAYIIPATPDRHTAISDDGVHHKPDILQSLWGHRDYGFSCAWADDGYTLATGGQDRAVKIWDARRWCNSNGDPQSIVTLKTEMAGARSLHFSPVGSGKRLLIAAEEADIINIIDAQTFATAQKVEFLGEIAGVSQTADGQNLMALCADSMRGGLLQFERNLHWQAEAAAVHDEGDLPTSGMGMGMGMGMGTGLGLGGPSRPELRWRKSNTFDWKWCGIGHGTDVSAAAHARRLRVSAKRIRAAAAARSRRAHGPPPLDDVFDCY